MYENIFYFKKKILPVPFMQIKNATKYQERKNERENVRNLKETLQELTILWLKYQKLIFKETQLYVGLFLFLHIFK